MAYTAEYWEYDARLLRRWNTDPIEYEWQSTYACFNNNPIYYADPLGLEGGGDKDGKNKGGDSSIPLPSTVQDGTTTEVVKDPMGTTGMGWRVNAERSPSQSQGIQTIPVESVSGEMQLLGDEVHNATSSWDRLKSVGSYAVAFLHSATQDMLAIPEGTKLRQDDNDELKLNYGHYVQDATAGRESGHRFALLFGMTEFMVGGLGGGYQLSVGNVHVAVPAALPMIHGALTVSTASYNMSSTNERNSQAHDGVGSDGANPVNENEVKIIFSTKKDSKLLKLAKDALDGNTLLQNEVFSLISQLRKGNWNPGSGTKHIGNGIYELRSRNGARVYFRNTSNNSAEILGYSNKANQQQVINRILKLYGN